MHRKENTNLKEMQFGERKKFFVILGLLLSLFLIQVRNSLALQIYLTQKEKLKNTVSELGGSRIYQIDCFEDFAVIFSSKLKPKGSSFLNCSPKMKNVSLSKLKLSEKCYAEFTGTPFFSINCGEEVYKLRVRTKARGLGSNIRRTEEDIKSDIFSVLEGDMFRTFVFKNSVKLLGFFRVSDAFTIVSLPKHRDFLIVIGISNIPSVVSESETCVLFSSDETIHETTNSKKENKARKTEEKFFSGKIHDVVWTMLFGGVKKARKLDKGACAISQGGAKFIYLLTLSHRKFEVGLKDKL